MEPSSQIVGVVGRLELEKGHPTLLEAWPIVLRSVPEAYLLIVGEGSRLDALHDIARDMRILHRVVFTGRRDDIPAVTAAFDVAVLPSYREAQGLTILEAMALSRPVVASNVGGIPEMIEDGVTGLLVPPHDPPALAGAIVRLLAEPPAGRHARPGGPRPRPRPVLHPAHGQGRAGAVRRGRPRDPAPRGRRGRRLSRARPYHRALFVSAAPRSIGSMRLSFDRLWVVIALALPALLSLLVPLPAVDLAYQVRAGDEILATGALPAVDTWTYTIAGTPWVDQQWLAQVCSRWGTGSAAGSCSRWPARHSSSLALGLLLAALVERGTSTRTAAVPHAGRVPARGARPRAPAATVRDRALRGAAVARRGPVVAAVGRTAHARRSSSCGRTSTAASSSRRSSSAYAWLEDVVAAREWRPVAARAAGRDRGDARQPVRDRRLGVCRELRHGSRDQRHRQRVAADVAADRARARCSTRRSWRLPCCSLRRRRRRAASWSPTGCGSPAGGSSARGPSAGSRGGRSRRRSSSPP